MSDKNIQLSVVVPLFNEEDNVNALFDRIHKVLGEMDLTTELIFVNDGSKDKTLAKVFIIAQQYKCVKYIDFSRNF